jgi:hypothetical protein
LINLSTNYGWTYPGNWPGKISIIISDPDNNDVVSKTVAHTQHVYYQPRKLGTHNVRYVQNNKQSWDLWLALWHYEGEDECPPGENCPVSDGDISFTSIDNNGNMKREMQ